MRILIVSDVHGKLADLLTALERQPTARHIFCLGDGAEQYEEAAALYPDRLFHIVAGNCDFSRRDLPLSEETVLFGKRIFATHGHREQVKYGLGTLLDEAARRQTDLLLFGHTHTPLRHYEDGMHILNPGSLGYDGCYAVADFTPAGQIMTILMKV